MSEVELKGTDEGAAMTRAEFRERNGGMSKSFFHELIAKGRGPKEMRMGTKIVITPLAEAEWRRARENPIGQEAQEIAATAAALRERGRKAAKKSVASPHHVSNRRDRRGPRSGRRS